jgi:hypothetical protein
MSVQVQEGTAPQSAAYRHSRALFAFLGLVFGGLLYLGGYGVVAAPEFTMKLLGLLLAGFGGSMLWVLAEQFLIPSPLLTIDAEGLWDRRISGAPLPWSAIKRIYPQQFDLRGLSRSLRIELSDPSCFRPPRHGVLRFLPYRRGRAPYLAIATGHLNAGADDVLASIESFQPSVVSLPPGPLDPAFSVGPEAAASYAGPSEATAFFRHKKKLAVPLLGCLAAIPVGAYCLLESLLFKIEGGFLLLGATLFALWLSHEFLSSKAALIVSKEGITLRDFGSRTIPWREVIAVKASGWMVVVEAPPLPEAPQWSPIARILSVFRSDGPPGIITLGLTASTEEIGAAVAHFRAQASEASSSGR